MNTNMSPSTYVVSEVYTKFYDTMKDVLGTEQFYFDIPREYEDYQFLLEFPDICRIDIMDYEAHPIGECFVHVTKRPVDTGKSMDFDVIICKMECSGLLEVGKGQ